MNQGAEKKVRVGTNSGYFSGSAQIFRRMKSMVIAFLRYAVFWNVGMLSSCAKGAVLPALINTKCSCLGGCDLRTKPASSHPPTPVHRDICPRVVFAEASTRPCLHH